MGRRRNVVSRISSLPAIMVMAVVIIVVLWDRTPFPERRDRFDGDFTVLRSARLLEDGANDGDSFRIQHGNRIDVFRLYFVDTCETNSRFPARLDYQGKYFGGLTEDQVLRLGEEARETVLDWLRHEPFEIHTRQERVMGSHRLYAMVFFPREGDDVRWLSQRLVRAGLARIYTEGTQLADGTPAEVFKANLRGLEQDAKAAKRGGWAFAPRE